MAGKQHVIAFVWDFDKTLIPEYMEDSLLQHFKVDGKKFWDEVNHLPQIYKAQGIDHIAKDTLYLNHILTYVQKGVFKGLNNALLRKLGAKIEFHKGIPQLLKDLRAQIANNPLYNHYNITVEQYVVSTGLKEMILGSKIAPFIDGVWANEFIENIPQPNYLIGKSKIKETKVLSQLGYIIDNTTKTRALFEINKGTNKVSSGDANAFLPDDSRRVPFTDMVYIADGPSDIPCFSIMNQYGGRSFVVYKPESQINFMQGLELFKQKRVQMIGEANYQTGSYTAMALLNTADEIAKNIIRRIDPDRADKVIDQKRFGHIYHGEYVHDDTKK